MSARIDPPRYLEYGGVAPAKSLDPAGALAYLTAKGFGDNYLEQSRVALALRGEEHEFIPGTGAVCHFCWRPLMGGEFDRLGDGRHRCITCSKSVVSTHEEFVETYHEVRRNFEAVFEVQFRVGMTVRMENAKVIARHTTESPRAVPGFDARVLGFARETSGGYDLYIENGSPKLPSISTLAHELTHIWQYRTWDRAAIRERYGAGNELFIYEGMAAWASAQYLLCTGETDFARREAAMTRARDDEYGHGFRLFEERYPLRSAGSVLANTPFKHPLPL